MNSRADNYELNCVSCGMITTSENQSDNVCNTCSLNGIEKPSFSSIVFALAYGYFEEVEKKKVQEEALSLAYEFIHDLPYWKEKDNLPTFENLLNEYNAERSFFKLSLKMSKIKKEPEKKPDFFISHCWDGPDEENIEIFVKKLQMGGYNVWFDKNKWKDASGRLDSFLESSIANSQYYIVFVCKEYFKSENCSFEMKNIIEHHQKNNKFIFPIFCSDVSTLDEFEGLFIKNLKLLEDTTIKYEKYEGDAESLRDRLEDLINQKEGLKSYNGAEIVSTELLPLQELEKVVGKVIPYINKFESGFKVENNHIVSMRLENKKDWPLETTVRLPDSFARLRKVYVISGKITDIPDWFGELINLRTFKIVASDMESIPESFGNLQSLEWLSIQGTNAPKRLKRLPESFGNLKNLKELIINNHSLETLPDSIGDLSALIKLDLSAAGLKSLPETIGNLKSLTKLKLDKNSLSTLPDSMGDLISLEILYVGNNLLEFVPKTMEKLKKLFQFEARGNFLHYLPKGLSHFEIKNNIYCTAGPYCKRCLGNKTAQAEHDRIQANFKKTQANLKK